tara:strand:+ start:270 stop:470 length:201 start_codon:yes stop_codon:yes gene_type:complete
MKLKPIFSDDKVTVAEVDEVELHNHINKQDAQSIADILHDALVDMGIEHQSFAWDINVTVEMSNET